MIDFFRVWLPQIIGYAEWLQDGTFQKAWEEGDRSRTSVHYSDELYEQLFGDLHADEMMVEARSKLGHRPALLSALECFFRSLKRLDEWIEAHVDTGSWGPQHIPPTVRDIFHSEEWQATESSAMALMSAAAEAGFSSEDLDLS